MPVLLEKTVNADAQTPMACEDDPRWQLTLRVAQSAPFRRAGLLAQLLLYLAEQTLSGSSAELTEQAIGEHVFRRRPGYSTGEDNIVRTYAHRLRSRLDQYFEQEGCQEALRIRVPRGAYAMIFEPRIAGVQVQEPTIHPLVVLDPVALPLIAEEPRGAAMAAASWNLRRVALAVSVALLVGALAGRWISRRHAAMETASPAHVLWSQLFSGRNGAYIVTTDNGLGVLQDISGKYATVFNYMDGSYFAQFNVENTPEQRMMHRLSRERLTSVADSAAANALVLLPEAAGHSVQLRNARTLQLNDLKQANLVLLGSSYGDPWVALFEPGMNFRINYHAFADTYKSEVENVAPRPGEQRVYVNNSTSAPYTTYAVVALMPNLDHSGWVLLIEGLTIAGTEAAAEYVLHGDIAPLMREVDRNGSVRPFEVLLKTTNLDSEASPPTILLKRVY